MASWFIIIQLFCRQKFNKAVSPGPSQKTEQQVKPADGSSQQQQVSLPNNDDKNPQPLHAPLNHRAIGDPLQSVNQPAIEEANENNIRFAQQNGNIVPVGANEGKEGELQDSLPLPYDLQKNQNEVENVAANVDTKLDKTNDADVDDEQMGQVIPPPDQRNERVDEKKSSLSPPNQQTPS